MFKNTNKNISLEKFHQICIEESIPFVSYNLPYKKKTITLVQYSSVPQKIDIENELENNTGFIIAPFDRQDNENAYILRPDAIYETKKIDNKDVELILRNKINFKTDAFQDELNKFDNKISFLNNVNKIIENIHSGDVQKVVLSRVERVERLRNLSLTKIFNEFIKVYPNAFVYFFYLPEVGSWMGATPEPLIKLNCHEAVVESIAATKWAENDLTSEIKWTNKEYDEQKIVTKYIEDLLKDFEIIESKKKVHIIIKQAK